MLSYLPIQPGDTVDPARIDLALKTLFRTDLFADVKIDLVGSQLVIKVVENQIINQVVFEGNSNLKEDKLKDEVTVRPRGIFTRGKVQADVQRIIELYRRSGRVSATVTPKIVELPQKRVDLIFEIDEGPKSGVLSVNFLGNSEFSDNDLRDVVVTEQTSWYKFFSNNANYDPDRLEYDKEQLRKHYRNRGYYDFRVTSAVAELAPDKNGFVVTYNVDEDFLIGEVAFLAKLWGPIASIVDFDHDGDDADYYTSTDTNIDEFCVRFGYKLNLLVNTYTSYSNAKTCRKSWMKLIANDFKMDDKVCAFSYDTEGSIEDDFLSIDFWEHLIVDTLDGDQTEFDDLFGTQWFGDSDMCTDFAEDWFF